MPPASTVKNLLKSCSSPVRGRRPASSSAAWMGLNVRPLLGPFSSEQSPESEFRMINKCERGRSYEAYAGQGTAANLRRGFSFGIRCGMYMMLTCGEGFGKRPNS